MATTDPTEQLRELERRLAATPRAQRPLEHAALRYNLGLAYAELPTGDRHANLERALASYAAAGAIFVPDRFPVEHARVLISRGAALRDLGRAQEAVDALQRALSLIGDGRSPAELGAALNNLGLALSALGDHDAAIDALKRAVEVFGLARETERQKVMGYYNLAQAEAAAGRHPDAVATLRRAIEETDPEQYPYQWGMLQHSLGVSFTAFEHGHRPEAAEAFSFALRVFTRQRYPFQYALAKNNFGLACAQIGDVTSLRLAIASFEDALSVLDFRLHKEQWEQAYKNLQLAEEGLRAKGIEESRTEGFVAAAVELPETQRIAFVRERLMVLLQQPEPRRSQALREFDVATVALPEEAALAVTQAWLHVLIELPNEMMVAGLRARLFAHQQLDEEAREVAGEVFYRATMNELLSPQRMRIRDTMTELERQAEQAERS